MKVKLSNKAYDVGRYVAQVALPATATLYAAVGGLWGLGKVTEVVGTITAVDTFLGALLLLSGAQYQKEQRRKKRIQALVQRDPAADQ